MANYIVSYDLNGKTPTHAEMDKHIATKAGWSRGRVLETVWYIGTSDTLESVFNHFDSILSANDRLLVAQADAAQWQNLLIESDSLKESWLSHS